MLSANDRVSIMDLVSKCAVYRSALAALLGDEGIYVDLDAAVHITPNRSSEIISARI